MAKRAKRVTVEPSKKVACEKMVVALVRNCGDIYTDEQIAKRAVEMVDDLVRRGVIVIASPN
jgi:hypothetical protein